MAWWPKRKRPEPEPAPWTHPMFQHLTGLDSFQVVLANVPDEPVELDKEGFTWP